MTQAIRLRRVIVAALILTATMTTFPVAEAHASQVVGGSLRTSSTSTKICPVEWRKGRFYVKKLIRCSAHYYGVNADKALYIANRESNFKPKAYNGWSCAKGIYQHLCKYWPDRAKDYGFRDWSAFNARANIMVTVRMVKKHGWGPWGG
jgi:soluble lytic murein transglycosylase-like protein